MSCTDGSVCGVGRQRGAASSGGTRRESVRGGSVAASMPPHGPAPGRDTTLPRVLLLIGKQLLHCHVIVERNAPHQQTCMRDRSVRCQGAPPCRPGSTTSYTAHADPGQGAAEVVGVCQCNTVVWGPPGCSCRPCRSGPGSLSASRSGAAKRAT
ncbi:hypothetical protein XarbCFBP8152_18790 [Xanthomonas arboricola]|nr:hypothetical protein XarbCFBP8152_18790 [Xanthomonas arboricola]